MDLQKELEIMSEHEKLISEAKSKIEAQQLIVTANDNAVEEIKGRIRAYFKENGIKKEEVDLGIVKIYVTLNEGRQSVDCPDVNAVPEEFIRITKSPDKKAIGDYLKQNPMPNWAVMKTGADFLTIKSVVK